MINLLPPEYKGQLRAARTNVLLLRYNLLIGAAIVFLGLALGFVYFFLMTGKATAETAIEDNIKKEAGYAKVKGEADDFKKKLSDAKAVLDEQVSYSRAAVNIASLFPAGTAIDKLELSGNSLTTPTILTVKIKGEPEAKQLLANFNSSPYVDKVTKGKIAIGQGEYPYTMEISFVITKKATQ
jgi:hypothetical protein